MASKDKDKKRELLETKSEDLLVELEEDEVNERARKLSVKVGELDRHNDETRRLQSDRAAQRKAIEGEIRKLSDAVREESELRPVIVEVWADFKRSVVEEVRQDTGKVVNERAMRPDERQGTLVALSDFKNDSPKAVAKKLFSDGVRPEDVGIEKKVDEAAHAAGCETAAVLDALVEVAEENAEKKVGKKGGKNADKKKDKDDAKEEDGAEGSPF
jgi:hypothetical protein